VFGAGQIGPLLAERLLADGHRVRLVRRKGGGPPGVEMRNGDAADPAFAAAAADGASALYHCMNPAYSTAAWKHDLPRILHALVGAAARTQARLVVLDNLYAHGRPGGKPLSEDSPIAPASRKGEIRAQVDARLWEAHRHGDVRAVVGRASDFYGPRGTATHFGDAFWPGVIARGTAQITFDPEPPHTYHFTRDVAAGLATLGSAPDDVLGKAWMLPCAPAESSRAMIERFGRLLGRSLDVRRMPRWLMRLLGPFVPIVGEIAEMGYQWDEPFVVDDRRFRERLGAGATSLDEGAQATLDWARIHYGGAAGAPRPGGS
jgi:nucleoside-diphosphate-sugar epimerase